MQFSRRASRLLRCGAFARTCPPLGRFLPRLEGRRQAASFFLGTPTPPGLPSARQRPSQKLPAVAQAAAVDAVADAEERCHWAGMSAPASSSAAMNIASSGITGSWSPWVSRIGGGSPRALRAVASPRCSGPISMPGIAEDRRGRAPAPQADMHRHHRALAEADQRQFRIRRGRGAAVPRRERRRSRGAPLTRPPSGPPRRADRRAALAQGEPLPSHRRGGAALGRMRRDEGRVRQQVAPCPPISMRSLPSAP